MQPTNQIIGIPIGRVEGKDKVTGRARYSADHAIPNVAARTFARQREARRHLSPLEGEDVYKRQSPIRLALSERDIW